MSLIVYFLCQNFKDINIEIIPFSEPFYCKKSKTITTKEECTCGDKYYVEVSGSKIRKAIKEKLKMLRKQRTEYLAMGKWATRALDFDLEKALYSESGRVSSSKFFGLFGDFSKQRVEEEGEKGKNAYSSNLHVGVAADKVSMKD